MIPLGGLDQFFEPLPKSKRFSKRQIKRMSKKQLRRALLKQGPRQSRQRQPQQGLALAEMLQSKEFKQRVELLKEGGKLTARGGKIIFSKGKIAATLIASKIRKARGGSIYD